MATDSSLVDQHKRKKIAFYSPYVPKHFGGGEKHFFDVAMVMAAQHDVYIAIPNLHAQQIPAIRDKYHTFLGYPLDSLHFVPTPLGTSDSIIWKFLWTKEYDYLYYVTDGSLFFSCAKHNNLHIQIPFTDKKSWFDRLKLNNWGTINCNSFFTKYQIEKSWHLQITDVLHPMVDTVTLSGTGIKQKVIVNVGRFFRSLHSKRQDILISVFRQLCQQYPEKMGGYTLRLIGTVEDQEYFDELQASAADLPIEFITNCSRTELVNQLQVASIYWHAAGYGVDEEADPALVEHFGISTVEAMAAGCVPLVVGKGGQKEIMGEELEWCLWQTEQDCVEKTLILLDNPEQTESLRRVAFERAQRYGKQVFTQAVTAMFARGLQTHA